MRGTRTLWLVLAACGDDGMMPGADARIDGAGWSAGTAVGRGPIQETAAVAVSGKIYVIGGFDSDEGIVGRVQVYDTQAGTWSDGPALPRTLHHANAASDGATIYVLGALSGGGFTAIGDVYSFAPATDTAWRTRGSMPTGRERGAGVTDVIGGKLYVAGGFRNGAATDLVDVFDPSDDSWAPLAALPAVRDHACGGTLGGELVVAGGRASGGPLGEVWSYAPGANAWTPRAAMPTARAGMGCGIIAGELYATGGEGNRAVASGMFANVESYAIEGDRWLEHDAMPHPKHGVGGATWNGALYLCGGADQEGFGAIGTTDVFRP